MYGQESNDLQICNSNLFPLSYRSFPQNIGVNFRESTIP